MNGDISISGANTTLYGLIYAPKGTIKMSGANQTIYGRVVGNKVTMSGADRNITSGTGDLSCLPMSGAIKLME